jgi:hypothetical protein
MSYFKPLIFVVLGIAAVAATAENILTSSSSVHNPSTTENPIFARDSSVGHRRGAGKSSSGIHEYYNRGSSHPFSREKESATIFGKDTPTTYNVEVDVNEINEMVSDFEDFGGRYIAKTKSERIALMKKLKEAFRNTAAKMILNFGKIVPPLVSSWAQVMKHVQVNERCDQNCAVKCLDPKAGCETLYFNPICLEKCNCEFDIERLEPTVIRTRMDNITRNAETVSRFFRDANLENMKLVKPSFDAYLAKASGLHEEFGDLLLEHASKVFGCDEECLEDCLNPQFISFYEIPMCIKHCKCKYGLVKIEREGSDILGNVGEFTRKKNVRGHVSLLGNILGDEEEINRGELEDEMMLERSGKFGDAREYRKRRGVAKKDLDLPHLMKYSEYDRDAWAFFKRYQEDI